MTDEQPTQTTEDAMESIPQYTVPAGSILKEQPKPRAKRVTMAELQDQVDGLQMRCQAYEAKINGLLVQNHNLSIKAQKTAIKAAAYREMVKEDMKEIVASVVHEILSDNVKDHVETEGNHGSEELTSFTA